MTSTPTRPVDNVVITTKGLQDRNTNIISGTTVENKGKLILTDFKRNFRIFWNSELLQVPFLTEGFYGISPKSELALEIENNKCGAITRREVFYLQNFEMFIVWHLFNEFNLKMSTPLAIFAEAFFKRIQDLFLQSNVKRLDTIFERYDDISIKYLESTLRSKGKKIKYCVISNDNTKIQSNCNNLFSKIEYCYSLNKLQLVQFLPNMQT